MRCLECNAVVAELDNAHLKNCCGLTLQEYAIRHALPLDRVVPERLINAAAPPAARYAPARDGEARLVLGALRALGRVEFEAGALVVGGEARLLEQLFYLAERLAPCGFNYHQEYIFNADTHRVAARNLLRVAAQADAPLPAIDAAALPDADWRRFAALLTALGADLHGGHLFLRALDPAMAAAVRARLAHDGVAFKTLPELLPAKGRGDDAVCLRSVLSRDADAFLERLRPELSAIPCAAERFYERGGPRATLVREAVFDAAHFITDHPGKCANLHGGRYRLLVKVEDRIDPHTGFVMDYARIKAAVKRAAIERLDHKSLNQASPDLAWRSSTEFLCLFIWESLIEQLPNLVELQLYETDASCCHYRGPSLDALTAAGGRLSDPHFRAPGLGEGRARRRALGCAPRLKLAGEA